MKTYEQKLKTREWWQFRNAYEGRRMEAHPRGKNMWCDGCGNGAPFEVHHLRYIAGREPWEYEDGDLALICRACHQRIHDVADEFYSWVISLHPDITNDTQRLLESLQEARSPQAAIHNCNLILGRLIEMERNDPDAEFWEVGA